MTSITPSLTLQITPYTYGEKGVTHDLPMQQIKLHKEFLNEIAQAISKVGWGVPLIENMVLKLNRKVKKSGAYEAPQFQTAGAAAVYFIDQLYDVSKHSSTTLQKEVEAIIRLVEINRGGVRITIKTEL